MNQEMHSILGWALFSVDFCLRLFFSYRILQRRLPVGVAWSWLGLVLFFPFLGTILYLYLGEYRLGPRRRRRQEIANAAVRELIHTRFLKQTLALDEPLQTMQKTAQNLFQCSLLNGNEIELLPDATAAFAQIIADVDAAVSTCDLEFYIWSDGGRADDLARALIRAAGRGVRVRLLVDQIGSKDFLRGKMVVALRTAGVNVQVALPSGLLRSLFARPDLRIHRKILVIDNRIAYTGSLNIADPLLFKQDAGVGQWVDAACRVQGPTVEALGLVFLVDWCIEAGIDIKQELERTKFLVSQSGKVGIQCLPSGPAVKESTIEQMLITSIYSARQSVSLTTPYFIPSDAMSYALTAAARRGVDVTLIVPAKVDSRLTQHASQAFLKDLHEAGVKVALFQGGLLHTKSVVVDGIASLFGSLNLDPRSLRINFEITLAVYDVDFAKRLLLLQDHYLKQSVLFAERSTSKLQSLCGDLARLVSPLL